MKLPVAILVGAVAAIGMPLALHGQGGVLGDVARAAAVDLAPGATRVVFSLPIFLAVTGFTWLLTSWSDR